MQHPSLPESSDPVTYNLACARCRYLLRGLDPAGNCPECGLPIFTTLEAEILRRERGPWVNRVLGSRPRPVHPPLAASRPSWLRSLAAGAGLIAAAHAGMFVWVGRYGQSLDWDVDPDKLLAFTSAVFCVGVWLVTMREKPVGWVRAAGRWGTRGLSLAAPASAYLMWASQNSVPWWNYGRYQVAAGRLAWAVAPCEWVVFQILAFVVSGGRRRLSAHYYAGRFAATGGVVLLALFWPPNGWERWWLREALCCVPGHLIVFVYPPVLLLIAAAVLWHAAGSARRARRRKTQPPGDATGSSDPTM